MITRPRELLLHPVPLAAIALLCLNDHVWKHAYANAWTGKLSDFAGLTFFPLLLAALADGALRVVGRPARMHTLVIAAAAATAVGFALVKTLPPVTEAFRWALGALQWPVQAVAAVASDSAIHGPVPVAAVTDPTDLIALPCVAIGVVLARGRALTRRVAAQSAGHCARHPA